MKEHKIVSTQPVQIEMAAGRIDGQNMVLLQQKREVFFDNGVVAKLRPETKTAKSPSQTAKPGEQRMIGASDAPVDITSKSLRVDDTTKIATFSTGVIAKQGQATLETNELEAFYAGQAIAATGTAATPEQAEANKGKLTRLVSKGDVVLTQGTDRVTSNGADFDAVTEKAVLTGNVVMVSAERRASSDRADLDTKTEAAVLTGNVVISSGPDQRSKSDRADLNNKAETALLTGNVVVDQGRNRLQGRRLAVDRKAGNMTLTSPAENGLPADRIAARFYQNDATGTPSKPAAKKPAPAAPQADAGGWSFRTDPGAPIDITSETLNVVDKNHTATFSGAVHAVQGYFTIKTPELVATYSGQAALAGTPKAAGSAPTPPGGGAQMQKIRANGKVEVTSSDNQSVVGDWAEFDVKGNKVVVGANPGKHVVLKKGDSVGYAPKVTIDMLTGLSTFEQLDRTAPAADSVRKNPEFVPGQLPDLVKAGEKASVPTFASNPTACPPGRQCMKIDPKDANRPADGAAKSPKAAVPAGSPAGGGWSQSAPVPAKPVPQPAPRATPPILRVE
jgi:lipopolysaccharide export system protein LptA